MKRKPGSSLSKERDRRGRKKILIIEDDVDLCREIVEVLEDEGYDVRYASEGVRGTELARKGSYNLILLDIKLPGMTGFEVLRTLREERIASKILILSGSLKIDRYLKGESGKEEEISVLKHADAFMSKPFNPELIISRIKELIGT